MICVPTPLTGSREPDLTYLLDSATALSGVLQPEQLVVLESTTYPGTTRERLLPILEESGLSAGRDFHLAFSPERIDPGRTDYTVRTTPKLVGGITPACAERARELYALICDEVVVLSSPEAAELSKLLENIFRSVNIALVNELAQLCDRLGIDVWEVVDAAATKPFGFMRFEPGPGMGGHCLPVDPFYLAFKAREHDFYPEFIELAGKVNQTQPAFCVERIERALNDAGKPVKGSRILLLGVSYKAGVGDTRESPALKIVRLLRELGGEVSYHDPHVAELPELGPRLGRPRRGAALPPTSRRSSPRTPSSTTRRSSRRRRWWSTSAASPAASRRRTWSGSSGLHLGAGDLGAEVGQHREVHEVGQQLAEAVAVSGRQLGVDDRVHAGDDPLGGDRRRRLGAGRGVARRIDEIGDPFHRFGANFQRLGARRVDLDDQRAADCGVRVEGVEHGADARPQLAPPALFRLCGGPGDGFEFGHAVGERLQVAGVLVGELVVEGLPVEAGLIEHHTHGCGVVAGIADSLEHALENALTLRGTHQSECGSFGEDLPRCAGPLSPCPDLGCGLLAHPTFLC